MRLHYPGEDMVLNEMTRAEAPGSFARLPDGMTHYELAGPAEARTVVLVHGFSVPAYIWDPVYDHLIASGYRVLRYDLFGRGWSDRPRVPNNIVLFVRQLRGLLDALGINQPVTLAGLSMGGPISASFTIQNPGLVAANILIAPAGARPIELGSLRFFSLPLVGEAALALLGDERFVRNIAEDFFDPAQVEQFQQRYRVQMRYEGFRRSILSTVRNRMLGGFEEVYDALGKLCKPTLLIWGREDRTVPFDQSTDLLRRIPHCEFHAIESCGHIPHYEKPAEVNPLILRFLRSLKPA